MVDISSISRDLDETKVFLTKGYIKNFKSVTIRGGRSIQTATLEDGTESIPCMWFNQKYLKSVLEIDREFLLSGKIKVKGKKITFFPNLFEPIIESREAVHLNRITPEYPLTTGISKKWYRNRVKWLTDHLESIKIRDELFENNLIEDDVKKYLKNTHFPESEESFFKSIKKLSLYELSNIHLKLLEKRNKKVEAKALPIKNNQIISEELVKFIKNLDFKLTNDQEVAIQEISKRILGEKNLDVLLQGDVGSGKTIVAICASLVIGLSGYQSVILTPTTILAKQHFNTFSKFLKGYDLKISLVTSNTNIDEDAEIIIGTTAVIARKFNLINKLGLIVVDEQHKFGVEQREDLLKEYKFQQYLPHIINMSATPIPRSVIQIFFGDLEVIRIKEKPKNRIPIKTFVVPEDKRNDSLQWIRNEVKKGGQVYWVCSLITESETSQIKSAEKTFEYLSKEFKKEAKIGLLHGKMKDSEKVGVTKDFLDKKIDILVSTTVIEVGIDVPNANIIIIEDADRFGLSQLHQIRGRVGRSGNQSWCFLFASENISENGIKRLRFLTENEDGFDC